VESRPRVGTRVCLPDAGEIRDRYQVREALESQAARLYAERAGPREKRTLERMAEHMDALFNRSAASTGNGRDFQYAVHSYHLEFHLRIAEFAGNLVLRSLIETNHVLIFNWLFDVAASRPSTKATHSRAPLAGGSAAVLSGCSRSRWLRPVMRTALPSTVPFKPCPGRSLI